MQQRKPHFYCGLTRYCIQRFCPVGAEPFLRLSENGETFMPYKYSHGGNAAFENGKANVLDLSANINPLGMPDGVRDAIVGEISNIQRYPDSFSRQLCEKIADFENADPGWIFCGNGASDIIFRLPRAVNAKKALVSAPAFSDYERSASSFGSEIMRYALSAGNSFDLDSGFIEAARNGKPDLVFVCNPNNPTGRLTKSSFIKELLEVCSQTGAVAAVDECFLDFSEKAEEYTSKVFLGQYPNLIILKAFTKLFALPGIRLGYAICADKKMTDRLCCHGPDWPVSNLAQAAGIAALDGTETFIKETSGYILNERKTMEKELTRLGYRVFEANANYVFFQSPYAFDLREKLDKKGIRVRSCGDYHGLDNSYYRIAVSTRVNNARLLAAIAGINGEYIC
jgi:threonine-phosphate decarboxylase